MHTPIAAWGFFIFTILMTGLIIDNVEMMATHSYVQAAGDAAADAGANQRQLSVQNGDIHEFTIEPIMAQNVAQATFEKNLQNMQDMSIDTSLIEMPTYSFPDAYTIQVDVDFQHDMKVSENFMQNVFDSGTTFEPINDTIQSFSDLNHRK